jgi:hypothetical protein
MTNRHIKILLESITVKRVKILLEQSVTSLSNFLPIFYFSFFLSDFDIVLIGYFSFALILLNGFSSAIIHSYNDKQIHINGYANNHLSSQAIYFYFFPALSLLLTLALFHSHPLDVILLATSSLFGLGFVELLRRQQLQKNNIMMALEISGLRTAVLCVAMLFTLDFEAFLRMWLGSTVFILCILFKRKHIKPSHIRKKQLVEYFYFARFNLINIPISSVLSRAPLFILDNLSEVQAASLYVKLTNILNLSNILIQLFPNYISSRLNRDYIRDKTKYYKNLLTCLKLSLGAYLAVLVAIYFSCALVEEYMSVPLVASCVHVVITWAVYAFPIVAPIFVIHMRCINKLHLPPMLNSIMLVTLLGASLVLNFLVSISYVNFFAVYLIISLLASGLRVRLILKDYKTFTESN